MKRHSWFISTCLCAALALTGCGEYDAACEKQEQAVSKITMGNRYGESTYCGAEKQALKEGTLPYMLYCGGKCTKGFCYLAGEVKETQLSQCDWLGTITSTVDEITYPKKEWEANGFNKGDKVYSYTEGEEEYILVVHENQIFLLQ